MKAIALVVLLSSAAFAQGRAAIPPQGAGTMQFHGGVYRGPTPPFSITDPGFVSRLAGTVGAFGLPPAARRPSTPYRGGVAYAYPVYVGGYGYYEPPAPAQPNVTVVYPPPQPPVVINQNFTSPPATSQTEPEETVHRYRNSAPAAVEDVPANSGNYYLIAFKDHSIYSAVAYYVEGDTLHYFTAGNVHNQASMSLVDRELTKQLNKDRKSAVNLP